VRELDLEWTPERKGLGLDADTAEIILVDITDRILVAGMSGAGKSVVLRVLMVWALSLPNTALAIIDVKTEGALWAHTARVEHKPKDIEELVTELIEEMQEREDIMRATGEDKWQATEDRPRIIVVIDEGAEFMGWVPDAVDGIRTLAVRGRAAEIVVWWATQKPTLTGPGKGLDSMISGQFMAQICLAVNSPAEARNVLGENATGDGWHPETLPKGGWALMHLQGENGEPNPMRVWHMTKEHVKALAHRKPWCRERLALVSTPPDILSVALKLSEGKPGVSTAALASFFGISDVEVHKRMNARGVLPEPNAFAIGDGDKARGYRRSKLEEAEDK
jgi:S-DNA-T family DNA segregation ATPase FtsK/SpoIIIE